MNGARSLKIHQDGAAPGHHRPTLTTGGQPLIGRCTRGYKHNPLNTEPGVSLFYKPIWPPGRRYASVEANLIPHNYYSL